MSNCRWRDGAYRRNQVCTREWKSLPLHLYRIHRHRRSRSSRTNLHLSIVDSCLRLAIDVRNFVFWTEHVRQGSILEQAVKQWLLCSVPKCRNVLPSKVLRHPLCLFQWRSIDVQENRSSLAWHQVTLVSNSITVGRNPSLLYAQKTRKHN